MLTKTVSIPALPLSTNTQAPVSFPVSPDMVPNKAQKLEERYIKSAQKVEATLQPVPVGPPSLMASKDLMKSFNATAERLNSMETTPKGPPTLSATIS